MSVFRGMMLLVTPTMIMAQQRSFTDSLGITHVFTGKPTVAAYASRGALALREFGVGDDQLLAVRGLWNVRGSNQDPSNPDTNDIFAPVDPTPDELRWLSTRVNLSPMCHISKDGSGCWEDVNHYDWDLVERVKPDYYVMVDGSSDHILPVREELLKRNVTPILIDYWYQTNPQGCPVDKEWGVEDHFTGCKWKSMLHVVQQLEDLALALTGNQELPEEAKQAKQDACTAAENFQSSMQAVHQKGLRVGTTLVWIEGEIQLAMAQPLEHYQIRMYEELGMPAIHPPGDPFEYETFNTTVWFPKCNGDPDETCNDKVHIPVDFWLIDTGSYVLATSEDFLSIFPDRALLAGQVWYFARNDGKFSYSAIAIILNELAVRLDKAEPLYPETPCVQVDVTSLEHADYLFGGLDGGTYACYNTAIFPDDYLTCPNLKYSATAPNKEPTASGPLAPTAPGPSTPIVPPAPSSPTAPTSLATILSVSLWWYILILPLCLC